MHILFIDSNRSGFGRSVIEYAQSLGATTFATFHPEYFIAPDERPHQTFLGRFDNILIHDTHNDIPGLIARLQSIHHRTPFTAVIATSDAEAQTAAAIAEQFGLPSPGLSAVKNCVDKSRSREALHSAGVRQPGWGWVQSPTAALPQAHGTEQLDFPVVAKAPDSSDSMYVTLARTPEDLLAATVEYFGLQGYSRDMTPNNKFLIEEYVEGPLYSVEGYCQAGEVFPLGVTTRDLSQPPHFVELGAGHPWHGDETNLIVAEAEAALKAVGYQTGFFHVELILSNGVPKIVEINPRLVGLCIATGMEQVYGTRFEQLLVSLMSGEQLPELTARGFTYVAMSQATPGQVITKHISMCQDMPGIVHCQQKIRVGTKVETVQGSNADIVALVVAIGGSFSEAQRRALAAIKDYET